MVNIGTEIKIGNSVIVHNLYCDIRECMKDNKNNQLINHSNLNYAYWYVVFINNVFGNLYACIPYSTFRLLRNNDFTINGISYEIARV